MVWFADLIRELGIIERIVDRSSRTKSNSREFNTPPHHTQRAKSPFEPSYGLKQLQLTLTVFTSSTKIDPTKTKAARDWTLRYIKELPNAVEQTKPDAVGVADSCLAVLISSENAVC